MLIRSAPSACAIPAITPGRSGTCTRSRCSSPGVLVGGLEQPAAIRRRLADPAREEARVARRERGLDLLEAPAMLGERRAERLAVLEEDVDPDARVRAGDARHVAQRAAGVERAARARPRARLRPGSGARSRARAGGGSSPPRAGRATRGRSRPERRRARRRSGAAPCSSPARSRRPASGTRSRRRTAPPVARSGPRASEPQIGWPPTKRAIAAGRSDDRRPSSSRRP